MENQETDEPMNGALGIQREWEERIKQLMRGRSFDELTPGEREEFLVLGKSYNERIDEKLEALFPALKETKD